MTSTNAQSLTVVTLFFHLAGHTVFAQQDSAVAEPTTFALEKSSQALQFHFVGQFSMSYKYHLSGQSALRLTADISGLFRNDKEDYTYRNQSTDSRDTKINNQQFRISPEYLYYFNSGNRAKIFVGAGPFVGFSRKHRDYSHVETNPDRVFTLNETTTAWEYGVLGAAGIECHLTDYLSVLAGYEVSASYAPTDYDSFAGGTESPSPHSSFQRIRTWKIELSLLRVGVGIYL